MRLIYKNDRLRYEEFRECLDVTESEIEQLGALVGIPLTGMQGECDLL